MSWRMNSEPLRPLFDVLQRAFLMGCESSINYANVNGWNGEPRIDVQLDAFRDARDTLEESAAVAVGTLIADALDDNDGDDFKDL